MLVTISLMSRLNFRQMLRRMSGQAQLPQLIIIVSVMQLQYKIHVLVISLLDWAMVVRHHLFGLTIFLLNLVVTE
jgi:hypothetical protein